MTGAIDGANREPELSGANALDGRLALASLLKKFELVAEPSPRFSKNPRVDVPTKSATSNVDNHKKVVVGRFGALNQ